MAVIRIEQEGRQDLEINLRDPYWAAFLAWLWPGAGHLYQRRYAKGFLFMICIVSTFFFGMGLGRGRVVYASTRPNDFRWQYFFQLGVGGPALPALFQTMATQKGGEPYFQLAKRFPKGHPNEFQIIEDADQAKSIPKPLIDGLYAPPAGTITEQENDVLGMWHLEAKQLYDVGTLFTVVAGLLNILVIYDALAGPFILSPDELEKRTKKKVRKD